MISLVVFFLSVFWFFVFPVLGKKEKPVMKKTDIYQFTNKTTASKDRAF